jgi:hypothetical protein
MKPLAFLLTLSFVLGTALAQSEDPTSRVRALEAELARGGMRFEPPTAVQQVGAGEYQEQAQAELDRLYGASWFETHAFVREALGIDRSSNRAAVRAALGRSQLGCFAAFYRTDTRSLVIDESRRGELRDAELARALAFASRSQEPAFAELLAEPRTSEKVQLVRALVAGQGEWAALALAEMRAGRDPVQLKWENLDEPLAPGIGDTLCRELVRAGRDHVLRRLRDFGSAGITGLLTEAPASTEQLLHPSKLYKDRPRVLDLPQWPAELGLTLVREESFGELGLYALLVESGVAPAVARVATVGWDGDRAQFLRDSSGRLAIVARIAFDRIDDTAQFTLELRERALGTVIPRGFVLDWIRSENVATVDSLIATLNAQKPGLKANREDQDSTILIEKALESSVDMRPRIEAGRWVLPRFQLSIPVPEGWITDTFGGQPFLVGPQIGRFKDNLSVVDLEVERGLSLDQWIEKQKNILANSPGLTLDVAERRTLGTRDFAYVRYHGKIEANELDCTMLAYILDGRPVLVTMSIAKDNVEWLRPRVEKCLLDAKVGAVRPPAAK